MSVVSQFDLGTVILDGHTVIDTQNGLVRIEPSVFGALGIQKFVLVVDGPDAIHPQGGGHDPQAPCSIGR